MTPNVTKGMVLLAAAALNLAPGCASKTYVDTEAAAHNDRMQGLEGGIEENQRRIKGVEGEVAQVGQRTSRAQSTGDAALAAAGAAAMAADAAIDMAMVDLILEVSLSEDLTGFRSDRSLLPDGAVPALDDLAKTILEMPGMVHVEIHGHTDSRGSEAWNLTLGQSRADAVRRYLNERGIPLYTMSSISHGDAQPIADNSTAEGRKQNRRVVVRVHEMYAE